MPFASRIELAPPPDPAATLPRSESAFPTTSRGSDTSLKQAEPPPPPVDALAIVQNPNALFADPLAPEGGTTARPRRRPTLPVYTEDGRIPQPSSPSASPSDLRGSASPEFVPPRPSDRDELPVDPPPPIAPGEPPRTADSPRLHRHSLRKNYAQLPLNFEPNRGQTDSQVQFLSRSQGYNLYLTPSTAYLVLSKRTDASSARPRAVVGVQFVGANSAAVGEGLDELPGRSNYFLGRDRSRWITDLPTYGQVRYRSLYPNIDVVYYGAARRQLEFDFIVHPGANPAAIQLAFPHTATPRLDGQGQLVLPSAGGGDVLARAPLAYQVAATGNRQTVTSRYVLANNRVTFQLGAYDSTRPLFIDPTLSYSGYLGGSGSDSAYDLAADAAGNVYIVGTTSSPNFPRVGAVQNFLSGPTDAFVSKLDASGTTLIYSSFLGGTGDEEGRALALDLHGNAYLAGTTTSNSDFPLTSGAYQTTRKGADDLFVTKLNAAGNLLVYATLLGGTNASLGETVGGLAVDRDDQAHLTGSTFADDFPTTIGAWQTSRAGYSDAFVTKLNASGTALVYGTYLGGSLGYDSGEGIAVDASGHAYVSGSTGGLTGLSNFPLVNAIQSSFGGGSDAFVTKVNPTGTGAVFSTFLGGGGDDRANGLTLDVLGNAYLSGYTGSSNFPTVNPYQTLSGGDAFVTKVNAAGTAWSYSTYLGGNSTDEAFAIAVDYTGSVYVSGRTDSDDLPTLNPFQVNAAGGGDAFLTQLTPAGSALLFSSYLGGSGSDRAYGLAVDYLRNAYLTGETFSPDFPTGTSFQGWSGGGSDAFVTKLDPLPSPPLFQGLFDDTGSSTSDQRTTDQTLTLYGTAQADSTVTLTRVGVGVLGSVTANSSGAWTYNYTATTLPEGIHAFTGTTTANGQTGRPSAPFLVTVDRTGPTVTLDAPASTYDRSPEVRLTVADFGGLSAPVEAFVDVDLNNDGDFADTGELGHTYTNPSNGYAEVEVPSGGSALNVGTVRLRGRVTDAAGNEGTSAVHTVVIASQPSPWVVNAEVRSNDPRAGLFLAQTGTHQVEHRLDLDRSPGSGQVVGQARVNDPSSWRGG